MPDQPSDEPEIVGEILPAESAPPAPVETGYTADGVPTFESVREKIENRYTTSIGSAELASETTEGRTIEAQYDARQRAAAERLAQIRASMSEKADEGP
ncbi:MULTISPECIES: hypothetical protein [Mycolicibacterium]|uniref:Phage shock protein A (IM30) n=3 Tax=Mycolicibacterium gilvum TaxID=1804 RepID=E6TP77_MYCSR|nr:MULTISPECIES: hypothetical protein [Mycolicibacterium]ABP46020.1 conserved hypothetical protein [Mycolicibacterium gilvum PYR-GCK]ADT99510.1 hypothetical protein Mspyr1_28880 [Mycolicibacterium gilvum Spyr1]MBV5245872.1 hypothetical protein [Mycolicibacterium sp. PAM1]MCV7057541.1 hypothetical protein [Mycolicibacterium gilvum]STZ43566.1 phage shock protein A (IM30) [Mycolicibacterium gilvum]